MSNLKRFRAKIFGIVQGVGFRWFVMREAEKFNIAGYVRNMYDGTVEVDAQGEAEEIEKFIIALRKGPPMGAVARMEMEWLVPAEDNTAFRVVF